MEDEMSIKGIPTMTSHPTYPSSDIRYSDASMSDVGYYLKRRLSKSVYGFIYKAIVMKKRKIFPVENVVLNKLRREKGTIGRNFEEDDWEEGTYDGSQARTMDMNEYLWESTGEIVVVKVSSLLKDSIRLFSNITQY